MGETSNERFRGVANLFQDTEIKKFIKFYLFFIFILEILIFFFCFLCQLEPINIPFPWKYYFLASFLMPVSITFLLGIFVTAFNIFIYGSATQRSELDDALDGKPDNPGYLGKINYSLSLIRQAPFLLSLFVLGVGALIFSQIDTFFAMLGAFGEKAIQYILIALAVLFVVATVYGFVWMTMRYKLHKMKYQYEYKREIMAQLGMVVIDDKTVVNNDGQVITLKQAKGLSAAKLKNDAGSPYLITQSQKK